MKSGIYLKEGTVVWIADSKTLQALNEIPNPIWMPVSYNVDIINYSMNKENKLYYMLLYQTFVTKCWNHNHGRIGKGVWAGNRWSCFSKSTKTTTSFNNKDKHFEVK